MQKGDSVCVSIHAGISGGKSVENVDVVYVVDSFYVSFFVSFFFAF